MSCLCPIYPWLAARPTRKHDIYKSGAVLTRAFLRGIFAFLTNQRGLVLLFGVVMVPLLGSNGSPTRLSPNCEMNNESEVTHHKGPLEDVQGCFKNSSLKKNDYCGSNSSDVFLLRENAYGTKVVNKGENAIKFLSTQSPPLYAAATLHWLSSRGQPSCQQLPCRSKPARARNSAPGRADSSGSHEPTN